VNSSFLYQTPMDPDRWKAAKLTNSAGHDKERLRRAIEKMVRPTATISMTTMIPATTIGFDLSPLQIA
jgi:hypothetical protein